MFCSLSIFSSKSILTHYKWVWNSSTLWSLSCLARRLCRRRCYPPSSLSLLQVESPKKCPQWTTFDEQDDGFLGLSSVDLPYLYLIYLSHLLFTLHEIISCSSASDFLCNSLTSFCLFWSFWTTGLPLEGTANPHYSTRHGCVPALARFLCRASLTF